MRATATLIDAGLLLVFVSTIDVTESILDERGELTEWKRRGFEAMRLVLCLAYTIMEVLIGATAGKLACGIVITLPDGAPAPPWTRVLRWSTKYFGVMLALVWVLTDQPLFYFLASTVNGLVLIGCLRALGEEKRAWHDLWAHTAVTPRAVAAQMRGVHETPHGVPPPT